MTVAEPIAVAAAKPARRGVAPALCLAAVAALLGSSGAVRLWQDRRLAAAAVLADEAPIRLADLPARIGGWESVGPDMTLDTKTVEIAGCSDYVTRAYVDRRTGAAVTAMVAYGPATKIVYHSPAVCYPAVGFTREKGPDDRVIRPEGSAPAVLRSFVFNRSDALSRERYGVYAGFRHAGKWTPDSADSRKRFRHEPGMFKVQIQRRLGAAEPCVAGDPIETFAAELIAELDRQLAARRAPRA